MKLDDIFFAIGIIIITSLLIHVVYDDIVNPYPPYTNESLKNNSNGTINITENDINLIPSNSVNKELVSELNSKKYATNTNTQSSNNVISTQKTNTAPTSVQSFNSPKNKVKNNNFKAYSNELKPQSFTNNPDNKAIRQSKPAKI